MSFKTGFIVGAVVGYVLGAKAGRERYEQIAEFWASFTGSEQVQSIAERGKSYVDQAAQRIRGSVGETLHNASDKVRESAEHLSTD